jgi:hypothetical protein
MWDSSAWFPLSLNPLIQPRKVVTEYVDEMRRLTPVYNTTRIVLLDV